MSRPLAALLTCILATPAAAQGLAEAGEATHGVAGLHGTGLAARDALELPQTLRREGAEVACPFEPADPIRLVQLLAIAGGDAIRAEGPHRRAQSRLCAP